MTIPAFLPSKVSINVVVSDVTCCTCIPSDKGMVSIPTHGGDTVDIPKKHRLVLDKSGTLVMDTAKGATSEQNKAAVEKYVSELCDKSSPQLMAVLASWKGIDFRGMHQLGAPLRPEHIASMEGAFQEISSFREVLQGECQCLSKFPVTSAKGLNLSANQKQIRQLLKHPDGGYPDINSAVSQLGTLDTKKGIPRLEISQNTAARIVACAKQLFNTRSASEIQELLGVAIDKSKLICV